MPNTTVYTNNQHYQDIAAAIRAKNGSTTSYKPSEMAPAIRALVVGTVSLQAKSATPTTATQTIVADTGYDALSAVTIAPIPSQYIVPTGTLSITTNNTYNVANYASVTVNVQTLEPGLIWQDAQGYIHLDKDGVGTTSTLTITQNGVYDTSNYSSATVSMNSGFSTARVTFTFAAGTGTRNYVLIMNDDGGNFVIIPWDGENGHLVYGGESYTVNVPVPTGKATKLYGETLFVTYDFAPMRMETSGGLTVDNDGYLIITGDGTLTVYDI